MFKKFRIGSVLEKIDTPKIKAKANDFPTEYSDEYCVPLLTAGAENQGLNRYAKHFDCPMIINNCISISANGANSGICFYQPHDFAVLQDAYAVKVIGYDIQNVEEGLYLTGALNKAVRDNHDWVNKAGWNHIKDDNIELPVIENPNPDHKYTVDDIDWQYMRDYIKELERDYIKELDAYLQVTGLNDYELTEEDKKVLGGEGEVKCTSFALDKLFAKKTIKGIPKKEENLSANSNGYHIFGQNIKYQYEHKVLMDEKYLQIIKPNRPILAYTSSVGEIGMITESFYRTGDNGAFQGLFPHYEINEYAMRYILTVLQKHFANFGYATSMANIMSLKIYLPITQTGEPDFDYMERYIRAIEKVVIADVVKYKDKVIEATKKVVNE